MSHHQFERREWRKIHVNRQAMGGSLASTTSGTAAATSEATSTTTTSPTSTPTSTTLEITTTSSSTSTTPTSTLTSTSTTPSTTSTTSSTSTISSTSATSTTSSSSTTSTTSASTASNTSSITTATTAVTNYNPTTTSSHSSVLTTETVTKSTHVSSSSLASASASASSTASADTGMSTGTIIGIGIGCLVGIAFVVIVIGFLIRRWRRHREDKDVFDASQFRSSAVLLDDDISMSGDSGRGGSGWNSHLRPPTMIERHVNNSPASFTQPQYGYGPQQPTSPTSFSPGQIVGPGPFNEMDIPSGGFDNDPFAAAAYSRDPSVISHDAYLTRQPSQMANEVQLNREPSQVYHADPFQQQQEAQYVDLNRVPSVGSADAVGVAVTTPTQEVSHDSSMTQSAVVSSIPSSGDAKPTVTSPLTSQAASAPAQSNPIANDPAVASRNPAPVGSKRPDTVYTVYDPEDAYGGM